MRRISFASGFRMAIVSIALAALFPLAALPPLAAGEAAGWTRFRGPNGTGLADAASVRLSWSEKDFTWKVEIPGRGHSHPVFWGEKLFLTTALEKGKERRVLCLAQATGRTIWERPFSLSTHRKHRFNSYASSTPAVEKDRVYVLFATPQSYIAAAFDHDGERKWQRDLGPFVARHGVGVSPVIYEDLLLVQNDQAGTASLVALEKSTGAIRWRTERRSAKTAYSTPCIYRAAGKDPILLFNSQAHGISGVDPRTGKILWEAPLFTMRSCSSPVFTAGGLAIGTCGSGAGGNYLVAVRIGGSGDVSASNEVYRITRSAPYVPTPIVKGDRLYLWSDKGVVSCVKAETGEEVWRRRVGGSYFSSPICVAGRIYNASTDGEVVVVAAADEFKVLARNPIPEGTHATPAVFGESLYLRTFRHLVRIDPKAGDAAGEAAGGTALSR